jgi:hypothetical protein
MISTSRFFNSLRLSKIVETLASKIETARPLRFLNRTPVTPAFEHELTGRFTGNVYAADIVATGQKAAVYEAGKLELVAHNAPKLKMGYSVPEAMLVQLAEMESAGATDRQMNAWLQYELRLGDRAVLGIRQRINSLICAMRLDLVNYDRLGIKIVNGSFGMPADLKATPSTPWTSTSATPITDVQTMKTYAADTYGKVYDRLTLSNKAFDYATKTDEFKARATLTVGFSVLAAAINVGDRMAMQTVARQILDMEVEIEDTRLTERNPDGSITRNRVMPANKVELSAKADDNNADVMDWGNGLVIEGMIAGLVGRAPLGMGGPQYGPLAYYTANQDLDPAEVIAWGVARGFPRKHEPEATSVLTVGSFT